MMAAALDLDHPALADSDEALLSTYLEGYDAETVAQLLEQGGSRSARRRTTCAKVMLRSEAMACMGLDPLPTAPDGPAAGDGAPADNGSARPSSCSRRSPTTSSTPPP